MQKIKSCEKIWNFDLYNLEIVHYAKNKLTGETIYGGWGYVCILKLCIIYNFIYVKF